MTELKGGALKYSFQLTSDAQSIGLHKLVIKHGAIQIR
jgi:hypothetical protein